MLPAAFTSRDQSAENYETCKQGHKLCHINETGQSTAWKETCIKFKKYADGSEQISTNFKEIFVL